ncbi:MAG: T9SS type A sorting domain-containing protein [Bacteroidales bacterium]|nr:T9SS type A sorting domain-containing protein [Bacteroidales bacterium]
MKHLFLFAVACSIILSSYAQVKPASFKRNNEVFAPKPALQYDGNVIGQQQNYSVVSTKAIMDDPTMGWSYYDLQTNNSTQPRVYLHPDGQIGGVFTMSHETSGYSDRGAGYRFNDGSAWGPEPTARIELDRAGWPNYGPLGPNGEIVVSHKSATNPLYVNTRPVKGTGSWTQTILAAPVDASGLDWPRMVTTGPDHMYVHVIAVTGPTGNGGVVYNGLDGAIVYNRSLDGGVSWDGWQLLDGMTSAEYQGFSADTYAIAAEGDNIVIVEGDSWNDLFMLKSTDNGDTWTKTVIWPCQYNLWPGGDSVPEFYAPDGSLALAMDKYGKAHIAFGHMRVLADATGAKLWTINHDGMCYWNENMPLPDPTLDPDILFANGNYIGWVQDTLLYYEPTSSFAYYYKSMSTFPTIACDEYDNVFVTWSGMVMDLDVNNYHLRNIFARASTDNGATWHENILNITGSIYFWGLECIHASVSPTSDDKLYILFQEDSEAGLFLQSTNAGYQGQPGPTNNQYRLITPNKVDIIDPGVGIGDRQEASFLLSQTYPNPVRDLTSMVLNLAKPADVKVSVYSLLGQQVLSLDKGILNAGSHQLVIDAAGLKTGVYFISVKVGDQVQTRKMIVE